MLPLKDAKMPFDIASLRAFAPAQYQCQKCLGLLTYGDEVITRNNQNATCPICHVGYLPTKHFSDWERYIKRYSETHESSCLNTQEALTQAQQLAQIAEHMGFYQQQIFQVGGRFDMAYTPLRGLLKALSVARAFVNFTTYGSIPHLLIGALKVTAQRVPVRGVVSGSKGEMLSENTVSELTNYREEAPKMDVKIYDPSLTGFTAMPHQKLIVIDGLLAFKGSANFTLAGWRKAAQGRDVVEVVTELGQVIELNNRLFAPIWAELSEIGKTIEMAAHNL
jgi:phosphatidylserine/phosphatidylglycerophosphate/cardiolipin synthase-like enzyme